MNKNSKKTKDYEFDTQQILIVTYYNKLMILHCPFPLRFKKDVLHYTKGQIVQTDKVSLCKKGTYVFLIDNTWFHYYHFEILCYNL